MTVHGIGLAAILLGRALQLLSVIGTLCLLAAAGEARRLASSRKAGRARRGVPVSILKPLFGAEPSLLANLATFLAQDHAGGVQLVCGVQDPADPAIAAVRALQAAYPEADIVLIVDATRHGTNAKVGNLINIAAAARHPVLILSDSDMAVPRDYIARILDSLAGAGVGAVTCLYRGRGDAGGWSRLAAMGLSQHFLPSVLLGLKLGLATPCMGSTIALSRQTLDEIGGMEAFADLLADDYAVGQQVRARGLRIAVPPVLLSHGCAETNLAALMRQELRWNRTILSIDRGGYIGSVVLHPLPLALIGGGLVGATAATVAIVIAALLARCCVAEQVDRASGDRTAPLIWIPLRDLLSFALYFGTFLGRSVDWRGTSFTIGNGGTLSTPQEYGT